MEDGARRFARLMRNRQTTVAREFRVGQFDRFVFFPLPAGGQYADYLETVKATLPANALRTETIANTTVLTGPASLIPILCACLLNTSRSTPSSTVTRMVNPIQSITGCETPFCRARGRELSKVSPGHLDPLNRAR